jgi:hypothetical protein
MSFHRLISAGCLTLFGVVASLYGCGSGDSNDGEGSGAGSNSAGSSAGEPSTSSGGTKNGGNTGGQAGAPSSDGGEDNGAGKPGFEPTCEPVYTNCTGLCGPVRDPCTGETFACGGCADGLACDVESHTCVEPKVTCEDLDAECGKIRNTCGARLDCGDCGEGEECNPDTNRCVDCTNPACEDLGYECGPAWLGCGDRMVLADCGACAEGSVCNVGFNRCEPAPASEGGDCVPLGAEVACANAKAECGFISDGCGNVLDCGDCPLGESCATSGIANRCGPPEKPWECQVEGRECGNVESSCGGALIPCGSCGDGEVCNDNGKCGDPCEPALPEGATDVECGVFDDGCDGNISKPCDAGKVCKLDGTCCTPKTCEADYADQCGTALPDGCGGVLDCSCGANEACQATMPGEPAECCAKRTSCGNECNAVSDNCGGTLPCPCGNNKQCNIPNGQSTGTCCTLPSCGGTGTTCDGDVSNSCGTRFCAANSCGSNRACKDKKCCDLPAKPSPTFCGKVTNTCGERTFNCGSGQVCKDGACCELPKCEGKCGTTLTNDCGSTVCKCSGGDKCLAQGAPTNTCCKPRTCGGHYAGKCGQDLDDGCGSTIDCGCSGEGNVCSTSTPSQQGTCSCTALTCANYAGQCGSFPNGCGGSISCGCGDHGLPDYMTCGGGNESGVCGCTPTPCGGKCGIVDNGCGGTVNCGPC